MEKLIKNSKKSLKNQKNRNFFNKISIFLNKYIFPNDFKCIFCGNDIANFCDKPYCENCKKILPFISENRCLICSNEINNEATICDSCQKHPPHFKKLFSPFRYEGIVKKSVLNYKYDNSRYLAKGYAIILSKLLRNLDIDLITFVPMSKNEKRYFNHSKQLAEELSKLLKTPCVELLRKMKDTKEQKSLTFKERRENVKDVFALTKSVKNKKILLVDDIASTCSTLDACAEKLKSCVVYAVVIARNMIKY